jgi:hypothetical protein
MSKLTSPTSGIVHAIPVQVVPLHVYPIAMQPSAPAHSDVLISHVVPHQYNEEGARAFLSERGFPPGLRDAFVESLVKPPLRFFILDDSGSMATSDGKKVVASKGKKS